MDNLQVETKSQCKGISPEGKCTIPAWFDSFGNPTLSTNKQALCDIHRFEYIVHEKGNDSCTVKFKGNVCTNKITNPYTFFCSHHEEYFQEVSKEKNKCNVLSVPYISGEIKNLIRELEKQEEEQTQDKEIRVFVNPTVECKTETETENDKLVGIASSVREIIQEQMSPLEKELSLANERLNCLEEKLTETKEELESERKENRKNKRKISELETENVSLRKKRKEIDEKVRSLYNLIEQ